MGRSRAMSDSNPENAGGQKALLTFASAVICVAGLKAVGSILIPVLVAAFLAVTGQPAIAWLLSRKVPAGLAVTLVFLAGFVPFVGFSALLSSSITEFRERIPVYEAKLQNAGTPLLEYFQGQSWVSAEQIQSSLDPSALLSTFGSWLGAIGTVLSNTLMTLLIVIFMMLEATGISARIRLAIANPDHDLGRLRRVADDVIKYIVIKTYVSVITGVAAWMVVAILGVDYALLWGVVAFLLNFVPTIGSIVAALPPVALALVDLNWESSVIVGVAYVVINTVVGNVIEPRWMGRRLGLSTLIVFLSLMFWGWVWGPVGMLLSVPLTMVVKIWFEANDDLRWIGIMMGPTPKTEELDALRVAQANAAPSQAQSPEPASDDAMNARAQVAERGTESLAQSQEGAKDSDTLT